MSNFTIISRGSYPLWVRIATTGSPSAEQTIYYRINGTGSWQQYSLSPAQSLEIPIGDYVQLSGTGSGWSNGSSNRRCFLLHNGECDVSGNILSLVNMNETLNAYEFYGLFEGLGSLIDASQLILPSNTKPNCYNQMFAGCHSLTAAPQLPAIDLTSSCYAAMFEGCTSLSTAPVLPATGLADMCYWDMFRGCTSLSTAPVLPATTLANACYNHMFSGCTALKSVTAYFDKWNQLSTGTYYTTDWLNNVNSNGTFTKYKALPDERGVSRIPNAWSISYIPQPYVPIPVKFTSTGSTRVALNKVGDPNEATIVTNKNGAAWTAYTLGDEINLSNNEYVSFSGNAKFSKNIQNRYQFSTSGQGKLSLSGTVHGLISSQLMEDDYQFNSLFKDCENIVDASQLVLPQNTTNWCYANMFFGCINLTGTPTLQAKYVADWCYSAMFTKCFSLSSTPALSSNVLQPHCYSNMFQSCIALQTPTALSSQSLKKWCYNAMFEGCLSIDATKQNWLPAETLSEGCYSSMYRLINQTTDAPYLPSETFAKNCYNFMFDRTGNVSGAEVEFEQWPTNVATSCWLKDVAEQGTLICPSALPTSIEYRNNNPTTSFPSSWNVWNYQTMPLTFRTRDNCKIELKQVGNATSPTMYYSKDYGRNWERFYVNTPVQLARGEHISFSGTTEYFTNDDWNEVYPSRFLTFSTSGTTTMRLYGNVMSLINNKTSFDSSTIFAGLFQNCSGISDARRFNLPATDLYKDAYRCMFKQCINLSYGPKVLPATTVPTFGYQQMFYGCTSLNYSPDIKATTLNTSSLEEMFRYCENLQKITVSFTGWDLQQSWTYKWVEGVAANGTFYKPSELDEQFGDDYIPTGWQIKDK